MNVSLFKVQAEILALDEEIDAYAAACRMGRAEFFQMLDKVDADTVTAVIPLLERRISLFKRIWSLRTAECKAENVLLFSSVK